MKDHVKFLILGREKGNSQITDSISILNSSIKHSRQGRIKRESQIRGDKKCEHIKQGCLKWDKNAEI